MTPFSGHITTTRETEVTCFQGGHFPTHKKVLPVGTRVFYVRRKSATPGMVQHAIFYKDGRHTYRASCEKPELAA